MAYYIAPPIGGTLNDPKDTALGSSYLDGVERARRVKIQKKKMRNPSYVDPSTLILPDGSEGGKIGADDQKMLDSILGASGGAVTWSGTGMSQDQLNDFKRIREEMDLSEGGFGAGLTGKDREFALEELKRRKANKQNVPLTVLG